MAECLELVLLLLKVGSLFWDTPLCFPLFVSPPLFLFQRSAKVNRFKVGQKLEAVDLEEPSSIRVATVFSVIGRIILLLFDGQGKFQYVDCESEDIFPTGWCFRTGHPLHTSYGIGKFLFHHVLLQREMSLVGYASIMSSRMFC